MPEDSAIRYEIVKVEGPNFGMIGMFEVKPSPPPVSRRTGSVNVGEGSLVLLTTDIRAVRDRLVDMGAEIVCEPQRLDVRGTGPGSLEMTCRDPDGMLINLIERPVGSF